MKQVIQRALSSWPAAVLFALVVSIIAPVLFGHASYDINGFRIGLSVTPSYRGQTELAVPPFGEITARTHVTPVKLKAAFERIYPDEISEVAGDIDNGGELVHTLEAEGRGAFRTFALRLVALAIAGGALGAALSPRTRGLKALAGALIGAALIGGLLMGTYRSFDVGAFRQPRYSGALSAAPRATEAIAQKLGDLKAFRQELRSIARNVNQFYAKVDAWRPLEADAVKILHVSDIHNNPAAIDLVHRVATDFDVNFIVDTGDITDYGTPIETTLIEGIKNLPVPYVYVSGNHDSPDTIAFLKGVGNVRVLEGEPVTVEGVTVIGFPDPNSSSSEIAPPDPNSVEEVGDVITAKLDRLPEAPLILAVHSPRMAERFFGKVPIVLTGHTHTAGIKEKDGYTLINPGTTGAAGIRTFQVQEGVPYGLNLLHIERNPQRLIAIDSLTVMGAEREFRLERNLIEGSLREGVERPRSEIKPAVR